MNRYPLHGDPPRGPKGGQPPYGLDQGFPRPLPSFGTQDLRSNFAVKPAASQEKIKLRKAAVKVVGAAPAPAPTHAPAALSSPPTAPPPRAGPVQVTPKKEDGDVKPRLSRTVIDSVATSPKGERKAALDDLFSRLNTPISKATSTPPAYDSFGPDPSVFNFEDETHSASPKQKVAAVFEAYKPSLPEEPTVMTEAPASPQLSHISEGPAIKTPVSAAELRVVEDTGAPLSTKAGGTNLNQNDFLHSMSSKEMEREYLQKALEYLTSLPFGGETVDMCKHVAIKLSRFHTPGPKLSAEEVEKLKARYVYAVQAHLNGKPGSTQVVRKAVRDILEQSDGNFLRMCSAMVDEKLLSIENVDDVVALCKAIMTILPKETDAPTALKKRADPIDKMAAWPAQEKQENVAGVRTCLLKGISSTTVKSINDLQALVWGGRLEYLSLPGAGSAQALIRFLTPEACDKYFNATKNGIKIPGDKSVIFVEKTAGQNSVNDVIRNCTEGDASRCIRAYDADEDWSDLVLMKLARGKGKDKREIDRIKRGRTHSNRYYIEFRFASIFHSLNFRRALMDDEEWEHCTISYAPDPCEIATGLHFKDEDEEEKPAGFS